MRFLPPSAGAVAEVRAAVALFLAPGLANDVRGAVLLALDEVITNAVAHSGTEDTIEVNVSREGERVMATVRDSGTGFDPQRIRHDSPPAPQAEGGRGLYIAIQLMDSVTVYSDRGTIVHMSCGSEERDKLARPSRTYASECIVRFAHPPAAAALA